MMAITTSSSTKVNPRPRRAIALNAEWRSPYLEQNVNEHQRHTGRLSLGNSVAACSSTVCTIACTNSRSLCGKALNGSASSALPKPWLSSAALTP